MAKQGQVVITEGNRSSLISKLIAKHTGSWFTHAFVVTSSKTAVEAAFPRVREFDLQERLQKLQHEHRAYIIKDFPEVTIQQRWRISGKAKSYVGRFYDVGQALLYMLTNKFWNDGTGTLVCSRLVTASYMYGIGKSLFTHADPASPHYENLLAGYATPLDLLHSDLKTVGFKPSVTITSLPAEGDITSRNTPPARPYFHP